MTTAKINRRTQLGYAVNTSPSQGERGFYFDPPTAPQFTGTVKTLFEHIQSDRYLNSLTNTYKSSSFFVKVGGAWRRITDEWLSAKLNQLTETEKDGWGDIVHFWDSVDVEVE